MLDMTKLGFEPESLTKLETAIGKPWGMVLVTGPTGSGKTNTLYSSIAKINTPETNIMTAEDPVEFNLRRRQPGAGAREHRPELRRRAARRSCARTPTSSWSAKSATSRRRRSRSKAALTGHLVLSTLHTNDAPSTINRLMNMGIEPFLVASSVNLICAQRLVRRALHAVHRTASARRRRRWSQAGFTPEDAATVVPKKGTGCERCNSTGYKGRVGLYEVMEITDELRELILVGRVGARAAPQGGRRRDDHAPPERTAQGQWKASRRSRKSARETGQVTMADTARTAPDAGRQQRVGPARHDQHAAADPRPRHAEARSTCRRSAPAETKQLAYSVLTDAQKKRFEETLELDFSFGIRGLARFRCNVFNQRGAVGAVYRVIPEEIKGFSELGLPPVLANAGRPPARPGARHRPDRHRASRRRSRR